MALTNQERLDALEEAKYSGVLEVDYGDRRIRYRSMAALKEAIYDLKIEMGLIKTKNRRRYAEHSKGL